MSKVALITGITGQDGSYLAELLLSKGYEVHGLKRRSSMFNTARIDHLYQDPLKSKTKLFLHHGDMTDSSSLIKVLEKVKPTEIYNLAAQSHVYVSFEAPEYTANSDGIGVLRLLEAIRTLGMEKSVKLYQASTSELYGSNGQIPQNEETEFKPQSPYAIAKLYAYWIIKNYRESYGMFLCNGILFNHESPRRGETFVTRKITRGVAEYFHNKNSKIILGNLDSRRDWGHAKDYVRGMWQMLQHDSPEDFVLATGETHTIRKFVEMAFNCIDVQIEWRGKGLGEIGVNQSNGDLLVEINKEYFRPSEVDLLCGDASKAMEKLNWAPEISLEEMVKEMVESDLRKYEINRSKK